MQKIETIEDLESRYKPAVPTSLQKVVTELTPLYQRWIEASRFVVVSTVGPEGTDGSPRGDNDSVVKISDSKTILLPDWQGNNRLDSLRNIVRDGRISLMFMVPASENVIRINGHAVLTADENIVAGFDKTGKTPNTVIVVTVHEAYFQCAKALMRSQLWKAEDRSEKVPTAGQFIKAIDEDFDDKSYDAGYHENSQPRMW